ncbi:Protein CBG27899 [Caenorhabditis briggsae]|uniref:Protein CBG27899 n=1 Tax=Caenorhabditis briggsae TaxID=6238 RepID=B6IEJ4_CAEBR|nr:Protein CBG27899 [Caenorhabditis briggsae]CAR98324.1 Protein CBG27899 [Caenorhabditis briggsae]
MSVLTFDAFAYGITNFDTIGEDELSKLEATKFSQIKDIEINMKSIIQILTVIKNLENELNVSTTKFFKIPDQFRYMGGHFAIDHKVKINAVLDADYTAHYDNEFRICLKILAQVRIDLTKACEESVKNLDFYNPNDRKEMELCVKLYYDVGFCNLAKWEVAVKILKNLFDSKNAMGSPVDSTQDVATVWNSYHSLDLDSGRNFVSNSPVNLNPVPSKSYIPPHMTRRKRNPFVKCYSTGQMLNSRLNRRVIPKSSIVDFNFNSNINQSLDLNPLSNSDQYSSPYMESPPPLSVEPQIPGMYLMPKNSDAPVYKLVPDGLAPEGWQNDPAWHQNVYKIGGTIEYQGKDYQMAKTWKEL